MTLRWQTNTHGYQLETTAAPTLAQKVERVNDAMDWIVEHVTANPGISRTEIEVAYVAHRDDEKGSKTIIRKALDRIFKALETPDPESHDGEYSTLLTKGPGKSPAGSTSTPGTMRTPQFPMNCLGSRGIGSPHPFEGRLPHSPSPVGGRGESGSSGLGLPSVSTTDNTDDPIPDDIDFA